MTDFKRTVITGPAMPLRGHDIDTDRIIPARFLRCVVFEGLGEHAFEDDRTQEQTGRSIHPFDDPRFVDARILLVNRNFGCGSSREHAPQAIMRWGKGIQAVVGESFAEIFFGNSAMIGMPCVTASSTDIKALQDLVERNPGTELRIDLTAGTCEAGEFRCSVSLPPNARDAFATGAWDTTGLLLDRYEEVNAKAARLPYVAGF